MDTAKRNQMIDEILEARATERDTTAAYFLMAVRSADSEVESHERDIREQLEGIKHEVESLKRLLDSEYTVSSTNMTNRGQRLEEFITARHEKAKSLETLYRLAAEYVGYED